MLGGNKNHSRRKDNLLLLKMQKKNRKKSGDYEYSPKMKKTAKNPKEPLDKRGDKWYNRQAHSKKANGQSAYRRKEF